MNHMIDPSKKRSIHWNAMHSNNTIYGFAYRLLGRVSSYIELQGLRRSIRISMIPVIYEAYLSFMILSTIIAVLIASSASFIAYDILYTYITSIIAVEYALPILYSIPIYIPLAVFASLYVYPAILASSRLKGVDSELMHAVNNMALLATSDDRIESILARLIDKGKGYIARDFRYVLNRVNLGENIAEVLEEIAERSPNTRYRRFLEGLIQAYYTDNIRAYLINTSDSMMVETRQRLTKITDSMNTLGELYVTLLIVFPLIGIIMLSMLDMLGGNSSFINTIDMIRVIAYLLVPLLGIVMLIIADSMLRR